MKLILKRLLNLLPKKCKHPARYQENLWLADYCRKPGHAAYRCRICKEVYLTELVITMKGTKGDTK